MYKKLSTLFIAALLISNFSFAKIFRVGYSGPQLAGVDFTTADPAVAAASANDTIQIYPGAFSPTIGGLTKKLADNKHERIIGIALLLVAFINCFNVWEHLH